MLNLCFSLFHSFYPSIYSLCIYLSFFLSCLLLSLLIFYLHIHALTLMHSPSFFFNLSNVRTSGDDTSDESMFDQLNVILGSQGGTTVGSGTGTGTVTTGSLGSGGAHPQGNKRHSSYQSPHFIFILYYLSTPLFPSTHNSYLIFLSFSPYLSWPPRYQLNQHHTYSGVAIYILCDCRQEAINSAIIC